MWKKWKAIEKKYISRAFLSLTYFWVINFFIKIGFNLKTKTHFGYCGHVWHNDKNKNWPDALIPEQIAASLSMEFMKISASALSLSLSLCLWWWCDLIVTQSMHLHCHTLIHTRTHIITHTILWCEKKAKCPL